MADIVDRINELSSAPDTLTGDEALAALARQVASRKRIEEVITHRRGGVAVDKATRRVLYHIYGSYYQREDGQYAKCAAEVRRAELADICAVKCSTSEYKVGLGGDGPWPLGWKRRDDGLLMRARPVAVVACDGFSERETTDGAVETAQNCLYDEWTGELDCGWRYVKLTAEVTEGGISCHTLLRKELRQDHPNARYYGVVWEYDRPELLGILQPSAPADITAIRKTKMFVEWVPAEAFDELAEDGITPTGRLQDVAHDYVTISGNLTEHTTWTAGTYFLTAMCSLGSYNLTLDTSGGDIVIKTKGARGIRINGTGICTQTGGGSVHCTSSDDDSLGEVIAGSDGVPAVGDVTTGWFVCNGTSTTSLTLTRGSCRYTRVTNMSVIGWGTAASGRTMSVSNWALYNCDIASGSSAMSSFLGAYGSALQAQGTVSLTNISIDSTNSVSNSSFSRLVYLADVRADSIVTGMYLAPSGTCTSGIYCYTTSGMVTFTCRNVYASISVGIGAGQAVIMAYPAIAGVTQTLIVNHSIVRNTGTGHGILVNRAAGTAIANVRDCIITGCTGTTAVGVHKLGTVSFTHIYNRYWNNTTDCFEALHFTEGTGINPQLGNLPSGAVIDTANCPFPDGLAVGNLALEFAGSGTFDSLGIDETKCTMTGWRYAGTKIVTPGIYYTLSTFPETFGTCVPSMVSTEGGTVITVSGGKGWGSVQSTGYVQVDGIDVVESDWSDSGCVFTAPAHPPGTVDVVCVNYRGAIIIRAGALTYYSPPPPPPPPPATDSLEDLGTCKLLWREPPNWAELPEQYTDQQRSFIEMGSGTREVVTLGKYQPRVVTYRWTSIGRGKLYGLLGWHCSRQGRLQRFWLPLWRNEFVLAQPITTLSTSAVIRWCGASAAFQGYERIFMVLSSGNWLTRQVLLATDNLDGTETLTVRTPWDRDIAPSDVSYLGRLLLVRHEEDVMEVEHVSAAVAHVTLRYRELVHEYDDVEPES